MVPLFSDPEVIGPGVTLRADCTKTTVPSLLLVVEPSFRPIVKWTNTTSEGANIGYNCSGNITGSKKIGVSGS